MASSPKAAPWILYPAPNPQAKLRLFCFPYAGGGSLAFRDWNKALPPQIEVCPVLLPGREQRLLERPFTRVSPLVETLAQVLRRSLDLPFAFFGHSMGALLSFEMTRELRRQQYPLPRQLFLSARRAPHLSGKGKAIYRLPEAEFVEELRRLNGTPEQILKNTELMQLLMPVLRADFELNDTYHYQPEAPLTCPISVYGGDADPKANYDDLLPWQEHTQGTFSLKMFPGDHFFLQSAREPLLAAVAAELKPLVL